MNTTHYARKRSHSVGKNSDTSCDDVFGLERKGIKSSSSDPSGGQIGARTYCLNLFDALRNGLQEAWPCDAQLKRNAHEHGRGASLTENKPTSRGPPAGCS